MQLLIVTSLIYYDVTNYYFETDEQTDFLRKGVSKEHRPNPIVQMGLFMDNQGIPITYELFPGNTNNCLTYRPNFGRIKKQFDLGRVISVADKGMTTLVGIIIGNRLHAINQFRTVTIQCKYVCLVCRQFIIDQHFTSARFIEHCRFHPITKGA